ncbi:rod shape-determining protein RodA [candidate division WOR-3 bacterium]|uniref:Rod shape-determining protein RodA n=1 Tax=candidate division WOR-3 bacterium TaxID=2052148 RepID=A0A660SFV8_UNCW3|nr:MAG: rod shape-determining protein RodA [candidate division WOR-3 bacterium]
MPKKSDPLLLIIPILLTGIGLLFIYSAGGSKFFLRQSIWFLISLFLLIIIARLLPRFLFVTAPPFYIGAIFLLIFTLLFAPTSPRRWLSLGVLSLQGSELAKIATILMIGRYLSTCKRKGLIEIGTVFLFALIPAFLVFAQPNLGSSVIFLIFPFVILLWDGVPLLTLLLILSPLLSLIFSFSLYIWVPYIAFLSLYLLWRKEMIAFLTAVTSNSIVGLLTPLLWHGLKEYQRQRIIGFLAPWIDPKGVGWQMIQSRIAFGSGRLIGKGIFAGTQKKLAFLPAPHTDFIVSVVGEAIGFVGIFLLLTLYLLLSLRILFLARECRSRFASLVVIGIFGLLTYHWFVNIGVAIGILPVTGIPLPFVSYGGSSLLSFFIGIGILISISRYRYER